MTNCLDQSRLNWIQPSKISNITRLVLGIRKCVRILFWTPVVVILAIGVAALTLLIKGLLESWFLFPMFRMFLEAIEESLDCSDNDEEALFAICLLYAAIGNKGELSFFPNPSRICFLRMACQRNNDKKIPPPPPSVNTPVSRLGDRRKKESSQRENRYKGTNHSEFY